MLVKLENIGTAPFVAKDAWGELHRIEPGHYEHLEAPVQGCLIDGKPVTYRCTPVTE